MVPGRRESDSWLYGMVLIALAVGSACELEEGWPWVRNMFDSAAVQPQEQAGRPPDDTLPVETGEPRPFTSVGEIDTGEDFVDTPEARARGKELFERYCAVCHAADATGADLGEDFFAADLTEPEYLERSDEAIYNVIIEGGLSMPSYRAELGRRDPWLVVRHLRSLQRADER